MDASIRTLGYSILRQKERLWVWRCCLSVPEAHVVFFLFLTWLLWVLVAAGEFIAAYGIFSFNMWDLVPWSGNRTWVLHWKCEILAMGWAGSSPWSACSLFWAFFAVLRSAHQLSCLPSWWSGTKLPQQLFSRDQSDWIGILVPFQIRGGESGPASCGAGSYRAAPPSSECAARLPAQHRCQLFTA